MRRAKSLTVVTSVLLSIFFGYVSTAYAGTLAGITLPDTAEAGSATLVLNGLGLRTKYMVKVYVAGLYLPQKSSDADAILKADEPKRLVMHFVRDVSKRQITDAFEESFDSNAPEAKKNLRSEIDRLFAAIDPVKAGDEMAVTYVPGAGTTLSMMGKDKVTISGRAFEQMLFSVWLGPKPPNAALKKGILGQ